MSLEYKKVDNLTVLSYFEDKAVLDHYEEATKKVGLWSSEELVFRQCYPEYSTKLLELGVGLEE